MKTASSIQCSLPVWKFISLITVSRQYNKLHARGSGAVENDCFNNHLEIHRSAYHLAVLTSWPCYKTVKALLTLIPWPLLRSIILVYSTLMHGALTNTYQWHCVECVNKLSLPVALCGMSSLLWRMDIHTYMYMYMLTFHGNNYRNITGVDPPQSIHSKYDFEGDLH